MFLCIGLGDGCELLATRSRLLEAETEDPLDASTREDRRLDRNLVGRAGVNAPSGAGIFALGVLADAQDVETLRAQRSLNTRQAACAV